MEYHDIGVALRLTQEVEKDMYRIANNQKERWGEGRFFLARPYLPHVTLYQGRFAQPTTDLATLGKLCTRIVGKGLWSGGALTLLDHILVNDEGWVFRPVEITFSLRELHEEVAAHLQRTTSTNFRESARRVLDDRDTPRDIRERIRRYGGIHTGGEYQPHVTIGRLIQGSFLRREAVSLGKVLRLAYPSTLIAGLIDEEGRMRASQVFWEKPMAELERKTALTR